MSDIPTRLIADRNRLLEQRLLELKRERITAEREQADRTRRELLLEIGRSGSDIVTLREQGIVA